ncbi:MaoC family dehydratase [Pseudonocardia spinosispora]|uniref:MaoC family dehydratase n=1 Tax=Pseudonocardia spinosispora TaxID=103441 RepID=UPI000405DB2B|nr:MaoC family dehydratase [Pseudonocardia spinosispora]
MGDLSALTATDNYFENFVPGDRFRHARGKTVTEMDNVLITNLVMNTAQGHFNEDLMADREFGRRIVFGGITASMVVGLASQDTAENALAELGMTAVRFRSPVFHGDTLYATTEVVAVEDSDRPDAGVVTFDHTGHNQDGTVVFTGRRRVLLKRASHWASR